jgi:hypothetical protein
VSTPDDLQGVTSKGYPPMVLQVLPYSGSLHSAHSGVTPIFPSQESPYVISPRVSPKGVLRGTPRFLCRMVSQGGPLRSPIRGVCSWVSLVGVHSRVSPAGKSPFKWPVV